MFAAESYNTAGHAEIYARGDMTSAIQQGLKSRIAELRTYQATNGYDVTTPSKKGLPTTNNWRLRPLTDEARVSIYLQFALIPPVNDVGFSAIHN